jgi:hypothetical protein
VPRRGITTHINNYHLTTFVPAISRVSDRITVTQFVPFVNKHNLFCNSQFGFRKHKSTKDPIASIIDNVTENLANKLYSNSFILIIITIICGTTALTGASRR